MNALEQEFVERIAAARDETGITGACSLLKAIARPARTGTEAVVFNRELASALKTHLARMWPHPQFEIWLETYLGNRPARFRSPLQQPNYLYYPSLAPKAWFDTAEVPELDKLAHWIPRVSDELQAYLGTASAAGFSPYVSKEASRSEIWRPLAGSEAWSALHLVRRDLWDDRHLAHLPETAGFLRAAPLALCPPHAPECFVSRLSPGAVLPPHFGLSNIKLTAHLPIDLPSEGCSITVADITRTWRKGDFLIFDDSFRHSARNLSERSRIVLIFDIWHPNLSDVERQAIAYSIRVLDQVRAATG